MNKKMLKGIFVAAVIVFAWGMVSWMLLPWHQMTLLSFQNEAAVAETIRDNAKVSGMYVLPNMFACCEKMSASERKQQMQEAKENMKAGPYAYVTVRLGGMDCDSPVPYLRAFVIQFLGAWIVTWMLMQARGLVYMEKVLFVSLFGVGVGVLGLLPQWNWMASPLSGVLVCLADLAIAWTLAGLALAKILEERKA